jgi:3-hydroxymyristoyl/3-hydroxydecanoyl-(acyl carrier protein) dehydratase
MNASFSYSIPFNQFLFKLLAIFALVTIIAFFIPFDFHYRKGHLNNQMFTFGGLVISILIAIVSVLLYLKSENSKKNPINVTFTESLLIFPVGANDKIEINCESIESVTEIGNKFNGEIIQIKSKDNSFKKLFVQAKGFETDAHYTDFMNQLKANTQH